MLSQLTIRNFAIVDHLQIDWHPGLNVITGETGAGKSILIDAHGQSEHMALLRAREQLDYLDRYATVLAERAEVARLVRELRAVREAHRRLIAEEREAARLQDMLRHELAEIEGANLREDE